MSKKNQVTVTFEYEYPVEDVEGYCYDGRATDLFRLVTESKCSKGHKSKLYRHGSGLTGILKEAAYGLEFKINNCKICKIQDEITARAGSLRQHLHMRNFSFTAYAIKPKYLAEALEAYGEFDFIDDEALQVAKLIQQFADKEQFFSVAAILDLVRTSL